MPTYLINQPAGIGDIIFCQKIAKELSKYSNVLWPVNSSISYISKYIKFKGFDLDWRKQYDKDDTIINVNLSTADRLYPGSVLKAKYAYMGMDWKDWKDYVTFERNRDAEDALYAKLNPKNEKYVLVSKLIGTPPGHREIPIKVDTNKKIIEVSLVEGFTPFDWGLLLELASEIHMVDTSFNYIMELLYMRKLDKQDLHLYSRFYPNTDFSHIEGIFTLPWEYHTYK